MHPSGRENDVKILVRWGRGHACMLPTSFQANLSTRWRRRKNAQGKNRKSKSKSNRARLEKCRNVLCTMGGGGSGSRSSSSSRVICGDHLELGFRYGMRSALATDEVTVYTKTTNAQTRLLWLLLLYHETILLRSFHYYCCCQTWLINNATIAGPRVR